VIESSLANDGIAGDQLVGRGQYSDAPQRDRQYVGRE
jgi:hypothetical protein